MTEETTDNTAQGADVEKQKIKSVWKTIEMRNVTDTLGIKPKGITEQDTEDSIHELVEAMEVKDLGVMVKTIVYDGYLPSTSTIFIPGAKLIIDSKREVDGHERYSIVK